MKYLSKIPLILVLLLIISCRLSPSKDDNVLSTTKDPQMALVKVAEKPHDSLLIGTWEVDSFSYQFMNELTDIEDKKITIKLNKDNTLTSTNLPKFDTNNFEKLSKLINPRGKWKLSQSYKKDRWQILIFFDAEEDSSKSFARGYDIYKRNDSLFLWRFIGDPDSGNRLLFKRK